MEARGAIESQHLERSVHGIPQILDVFVIDTNPKRQIISRYQSALQVVPNDGDNRNHDWSNKNASIYITHYVLREHRPDLAIGTGWPMSYKHSIRGTTFHPSASLNTWLDGHHR